MVSHVQDVEKIRCTLPLTNLFLSLARRFVCSQSCSVSLRTLWAYGFSKSHPEGLGLDGLTEQSAKL